MTNKIGELFRFEGLEDFLTVYSMLTFGSVWCVFSLLFNLFMEIFPALIVGFVLMLAICGIVAYNILNKEEPDIPEE